jgi:serine/threonine protein kinase
MGVVFEAVDEEAGHPVAIKVLHPELSPDAAVRRRFRRESQVLRNLDHPSIVRQHDVGEDGHGRLYLVMELLAGETLRARFEREAPLSARALLPFVEGIAAGLSAAHAQGFIHGDLTPANVFLTPDGGVKLLDFGLSKVLGLERLTRTGEVIGTPAYLAPELLTGKGDVDQRIDTYALGVLLYQGLAGRPPFVGRHPGKLMMDVVMGDAPRLTDLVAVPAAVASVVARAMHRKASERFGSAAALLEAFREAAS